MKFLKWLLVVLLAAIGLAFAVANRHFVTVSFDPFVDNDLSSPQVPLFVLLVCAVLFGIILGGIAMWFTQGKNRKAARLARSEAEKWRSEADRLRAQLSAQTADSGRAPVETRALVRTY